MIRSFLHNVVDRAGQFDGEVVAQRKEAGGIGVLVEQVEVIGGAEDNFDVLGVLKILDVGVGPLVAVEEEGAVVDGAGLLGVVVDDAIALVGVQLAGGILLLGLPAAGVLAAEVELLL